MILNKEVGNKCQNRLFFTLNLELEICSKKDRVGWREDNSTPFSLLLSHLARLFSWLNL